MARRTKKGAGVGAPGVSTPPESPKKTTENAGSKHHRKTQKDDARSNTRLYDLLRVKSEATQAEITKSYRALALLLHPDKVAQKLQREESAGDAGRNKGGKSFEDLKEEATKHFQELQAAYEVLKDPRRRKLYDETGSTGEDADGKTYEEAYAYYRRVYPEFDVADIEKYREKYLESEEEVQDILDFCIRFGGDLTRFFEYIPFSEKAHLSRYLKILEDLVKSKKVKKTKKFESTLQQMEAQADKLAALTERESKAQQQSKKKSSKNNSDGDAGLADLVLAIQANRTKRAQRAEALFARIEAKYGAAEEEEESGEERQKSGKSKKRRKN